MPAKKRCKHRWDVDGFTGDPDCPWYCEVHERCVLCGRERGRVPTSEEISAEVERRTCPRCKQPRADHRDASINSDACLVLLLDRVSTLENKMRALEKWRGS